MEKEKIERGKTAPEVYKAINTIAGELAHDGIEKNKKNQQQGYAFRGIDDVYYALAPLLAKYRLCILPRVLSRSVSERQTKSGGVLFYVVVEVEYTLVSSIDGSDYKIITQGEAMDSGDKATNKAMSAAYKYACIQSFCIPTEGQEDADATTPEPLEVKQDDNRAELAEIEKLYELIQSPSEKMVEWITTCDKLSSAELRKGIKAMKAIIAGQK